MMLWLVKVFICSGVLYGYYALALKNNTFHQWNRYYLLLSALLSLVLPLLQIPVSFYPQAANTSLLPLQLISLQAFIVEGGHNIRNFATPALLTMAAYILISTALLIRLLLNWSKIYSLMRKSRVGTNAGYRLVENNEIQSPFSFFNNIFWSGDIMPDSQEGQQILRHELAHVNGHHTTDKLLMEIVCSICWFNPFFYLLKRELNMVHEFIADKAAAEPDEAADYARTILQITLQTRILQSINNFAQQPVKRRIYMLLKNEQNFPFMKKIIILPVLTMLVIFISCQSKNEVFAPRMIQANVLGNQMIQGSVIESEKVFTTVETPPTFPGGQEALVKYLSATIKYPANAQDLNISGTVYVQFVVGSDGTIRDVKTVGVPKGGGLEEEAIRVVKNMAPWNPGEQDGKKVAVMFHLPIRYSLES
jgi:TonB family protein